MCGRCFSNLIVFSCIVSFALSQYAESEEDWIDPSDMLTFDPVRKINIKPKNRNSDFDHHPNVVAESLKQDHIKQVPNKPDKSLKKNHPTESQRDCPDSDAVFLKRFVSFLTSELSTVIKSRDHTEYSVSVEMHEHDWRIFLQFCEDSNSIAVQEVSHRLESIFKNFALATQKEDATWRFKIEDTLHVNLDDAIKILSLLLMGIAILSLEAVSKVSWSVQLKRLTCIMILLSLGWTYVHQYQIAVAKHRSSFMKVPKHCLDPENQKSTWEEITGFMRDLFSTSEDPCVQYHIDNLISPVSKVPPTKILAVTLSEFLLEPLSHMGSAFSKSFRNMFSDLPVQLWLPAFIFAMLVMIALLLVLTVYFGYAWNLHLPFWTGFEIAPQRQGLAARQHEEILMYRRQIENMQSVITAQRDLQNAAPPAIELPQNQNNSWGSYLLQFFQRGQQENPPEQVPVDPQAAAALPEPSPPADPGAAGEPSATTAQGGVTDFPMPPATSDDGSHLRRRAPYPTNPPYPMQSYNPSHFNASSADLPPEPPTYEESVACHSPSASSSPTREIGFARHIVEDIGDETHETRFPHTSPTLDRSQQQQESKACKRKLPQKKLKTGRSQEQVKRHKKRLLTTLESGSDQQQLAPEDSHAESTTTPKEVNESSCQQTETDEDYSISDIASDAGSASVDDSISDTASDTGNDSHRSSSSVEILNCVPDDEASL